MRKILRVAGISAAAAFGFTVISAPITGAASAKEMFEGQTIRVLIGYGAGGGYDRYGRQLARHISKYLPGKPNVVAVNRPGAGGLKVVNHLYNISPKSGIEFGTFARSAALYALSSDHKAIRYDPLKLGWLGSSSSYKGEAYVLAIRKATGVKSFADMQKSGKLINFAATGPGSDGHDIPVVLRAVYNINAQVVRGYPGGNTLYLAVDRGEMDARMVGYSSMKTANPAWLKPNSPVRIVMQFATVKRLPEFPDVPTARELVKNDDDLALIKMMEAPFFMARPFAAPPGLPAARLKALRTAFMAAHNDPRYKAEAKKLRLLVSAASGEEVEQLVKDLAKTPKHLFKRYAAILKKPKSKLRKVNWIKIVGVVTKTGKRGRFSFKIDGKGKAQKARMRGSYSRVKIDGKKAKSKAVKVGMSCNIWWEGPKTTPGRVECAK
jgi:tripartite-type tricarboxylate transporter receptor subunit TctC